MCRLRVGKFGEKQRCDVPTGSPLIGATPMHPPCQVPEYAQPGQSLRGLSCRPRSRRRCRYRGAMPCCPCVRSAAPLSCSDEGWESRRCARQHLERSLSSPSRHSTKELRSLCREPDVSGHLRKRLQPSPTSTGRDCTLLLGPFHGIPEPFVWWWVLFLFSSSRSPWVTVTTWRKYSLMLK